MTVDRRLLGPALLTVALLGAVSACSQDSDARPAPSRSRPAPVISRPADHTAELAGYRAAFTAAFTAPTDSLVSSAGAATGTDTPDGWREQSVRDVFGEVISAGTHQVQILCTGTGSLEVTVSLSDAHAQRVAQPSAPAGCSADGATTYQSFTFGDTDQGFDVELTPAEGTVAVLGYAVV